MGTGLGLLIAGAVSAEDLSALLQFQYQRAEQNQVSNLNGVTRRDKLTSELWTQTYQLDHQARYRSGLRVVSQFRWDEQRRPGSQERSRTPYGSLRVAHPWFGLGGSYRPMTTRSSSSGGAPGFLEPGSPGAPTILTSRSQEAQLSGFVAAPGLPRVDVSWTRRHQASNALFGEQTNVSRVINTSYETPAFYVRGGYSDLARATPTSPQSVVQRNVQAGSGVRISPSARTGITLSYDFTQSRQNGFQGPSQTSRSHLGVVNGSFRQSRRASWNLGYTYRLQQSLGTSLPQTADHEGALSYSIQPSRATTFATGIGVRTEHVADRSVIQRYANAVLSAQGDVKRNLRTVGSLTHYTGWTPSGVPRSLETAQGNLTARLHSGLDLTDVLVVSSTTDSSAGDSRVVTQNSTQLQATPVRRLTLSIGSRFYHAGPGVFRTATRARTATVDGRLRLGGGLELSASHTRSGLLPHNDAHTSSTVLGLRWNPSSRLQLSGTYSRTGSSVSGADVGFLRGGEFASGRILVGVTRTVTVIAGASVTDPGSDSRSKQFDALVSKRFGR